MPSESKSEPKKSSKNIYTCTIYSRTLVFILYHLNRLRSNQNHTRCTQIDVQPTKKDIKTRRKMMAKVLFKLNTLHIDIAIATNLKLQMKFYCGGKKIRKTQKEQQHLQKKTRKRKKNRNSTHKFLYDYFLVDVALYSIIFSALQTEVMCYAFQIGHTFSILLLSFKWFRVHLNSFRLQLVVFVFCVLFFCKHVSILIAFISPDEHPYGKRWSEKKGKWNPLG